jgi:hypothetical protein
MTPRRLAAVVACVVALACGKSRQEHAFEEIQSICNGLVAQGATLSQADQETGIGSAIASGVGAASNILCPSGSTLLTSLGGTCPPQSTANPECAVLFEWQSTDPGLCDPQGGCCFFCELRFMKGSITTSDGGASTPICATRWLKGQPCQQLQ